jgi:glycosyltransferase involved in cell wall biosynthesis
VIANIYTIISPLSDDYYLSGGHTTGRDLINALKSAGYYVNVITPNDQFQEPEMADLCIFFDLFNDPQGSKWFSTAEQKQFLNTRTPSVVFECAYTGATPEDYGGWRLSDTDKYQPNAIRTFMAALMSKSFANIFLSPLHYHEWCRFIGGVIPNAFNYFQKVDHKIFNNTESERPINVLYVGAITEAKGVVEAQYMFGNNIKFIGRGDLSLIDPSNYMGTGKPEEVAKAMNSAKFFLHLPNWKEASARTVVEAAMCGCRLLVNENVGACSFGFADIYNPNHGIDSFNQMAQILKARNINA